MTPDKSKVKEKSKDVRLIAFFTYPGKNALNGKTIILLLSAKLELHVLKLQVPQESTVLKIILAKIATQIPTCT